MIVHKGRAHPGRHQAIIDGDLFAAVQARLDANTRRRASNREQKANAPLAGRLFDADGRPMSPTFSYGRGGRLYRYYVSAPLQQGARRAGLTLAQLLKGPMPLDWPQQAVRIGIAASLE